MIRRIQNIVAESRVTLPVTVVYAVAIWLLTGLLKEQWWIQFVCFAASVALMMELNNQNLLIRVFSRMVSSIYIVLTCTAVFLFPSLSGAILQLCTIAALCLLYHTYQDKASMGWIYFAFLCVGLGSLMDIHMFWYVPLLWVIMTWFTYSLSWRNFLASLVGMLTPYWFWIPWMLWHHNGDLTVLTNHISALIDFQAPQVNPLTTQQTMLLVFVAVLGVTGAIHFLRRSTFDKIRTRQLYYSFFIIGTSAFIFLILQPQHYDTLIRIMIIAVSPLIGHFLALTKTKITNIAFIVITIAVLVLTAFNLWTSSSPF